MAPVTEPEIRAAVRDTVASDGLVIDEFVVGERGRIDIAVISEWMCGYELKSDLDTLTRLPGQMDVFDLVFDYCTLVVTSRHLDRARQILKRGWGLAVVGRSHGDTLVYKQVRQAQQRRTTDGGTIARLLWRDEMIHALDVLGASRGYRAKTRDELAMRLVELLERDELRSLVTSSLTARQGWRVSQAPHADDATLPHVSVSSRFLARRFLPQRR